MTQNDIVLYSTGCPKCVILEKKLGMKNVPFTVCSDVDVMQERGFMTLPMLEVDGKILDFGEAVRWVNTLEEES